LKLNVESWTAVAPGMNASESWKTWFESPGEALLQDGALEVKQIPPLLRRRFKTLGKVASSAVLAAQSDGQQLPSIFASRHGDTELTLSLLEEIAKEEPVSPTGFSLAVHNAIGGLLSIVRKDQSPMTAIASMNGLVMSSLYEAVAQLEQYDRVLCVIYDVPLPALYETYTPSLPFPLAVAFVLSLDEEQGLTLTAKPREADQGHAEKSVDDVVDMLDIIKLFCGHADRVALSMNGQAFDVTLESSHA